MEQEYNTPWICRPALYTAAFDVSSCQVREWVWTGILRPIFILLFMMGNRSFVLSQDTIRLVPHSLTVSDDSVCIDLTIHALGLSMPSGESLILTPSLECGKKRVVLPPVVFSGSRRARFDRREEAVDPDHSRPVPYHVWVCRKKRSDYTLRYRVSLSYALWMEHASLILRQTRRDCCAEWLLADEVLTEDIGLPSPCELVEEAQPEKAETPTVKGDTLRYGPYGHAAPDMRIKEIPILYNKRMKK
ncbi:hypothetical protein [uncultured Parabacteroides sp.]|uniref:hypothetical protein n=1 Tax=uncultured Parabacteroides sp. TaxID=512312 RepID=UPI00261E47F0|nr:hypothetical protein [uncultured Parabacteroides sp.]